MSALPEVRKGKKEGGKEEKRKEGKGEREEMQKEEGKKGHKGRTNNRFEH